MDLKYIYFFSLILFGILSIQDLCRKKIDGRWLVISEAGLILLKIICRMHIGFLILDILFGSLFFLISKVTKEAMGYGDSLALLYISTAFGIQQCLSIFLLALFIESVWGLGLMVTQHKHRNTRIPMIPSMLLSMILGWWIYFE